MLADAFDLKAVIAIARTLTPTSDDHKLTLVAGDARITRKMRTLILSVFILMSGIWMLSSCLTYVAGQPRTEKQSGTDPSNAQLARAKTVFEEKCARCHGLSGNGQTVLGSMLEAPNFTDNAWWRDEISNRRLINSVTNGKKEMPAFGKKLTRQEINSLVVYVRRFSKASSEK